MPEKINTKNESLVKEKLLKNVLKNSGKAVFISNK